MSRIDLTTAKIVAEYQKLDPIEKMIIMAYVQAVSVPGATVSIEVALSRAKVLIDRYHAGEELRLSDLEGIGA